ncbi:hypothetical protein KAMFAM_155 [Bacillus phage Kamfam]|nr:hypothetical protein OTK52_153 [Bacillus phage OTooleKemple52]AXQ67337.1 hypothetical protein KAMFAM_155 [Bacillus phage Kamfam]
MFKKILAKIKDKLKPKGKKKQTCEVFCPKCGIGLIESMSHFTYIENDRLVKYTCVVCGTRSHWDFDPPVPIFIREEK